MLKAGFEARFFVVARLDGGRRSTAGVVDVYNINICGWVKRLTLFFWGMPE